MTSSEVIKIMESRDAAAARKAYSDFLDEYHAIENADKNAHTSYFKNVEQRENTVRLRIESLKSDLSDIAARIEAMNPVLVNATLTGNTDELNRVQSHLADLEGQRAAVNTQIQMLSTARVVGDKSLYDAAVQASADLKEAITELELLKDRICDFSSNEIELWNDLRKDAGYREVPSMFPGIANYDSHARESRLDKITKHFTSTTVQKKSEP